MNGSLRQRGKQDDDYVQARQRESGLVPKNDQEAKRREKPAIVAGEIRKCHACGQGGHLVRNCPKRNTETTPREPVTVKKEKTERSLVKCYNCGKRRHIAMNCPDNALFCDEGMGGAVTRKKVEGKEADDILLDTGCSRTMVQRGRVPEEKILEGEAVTVRCAHGDMVLYPLAQAEMELDGAKMMVQAAVSDTLPVSVLLGADVPELGRLLKANPSMVRTEGIDPTLGMQM